MWRTILPKSSARAWSALKEKTMQAVKNITANAFSLVFVIVVIGGLSFLQGRLGAITFLFLAVMFHAGSGNAVMAFKSGQFVDVEWAHDVHHRQLRRLSHQDGHAGNDVALFHQI